MQRGIRCDISVTFTNILVPAAMMYAKSHDLNATYRGTLCQIEAHIARARADGVSILSDGRPSVFKSCSIVGNESLPGFLLPRRNHLVDRDLVVFSHRRRKANVHQLYSLHRDVDYRRSPDQEPPASLNFDFPADRSSTYIRLRNLPISIRAS